MPPPEDIIELLRTQLEEKTQLVRKLEAEIQDSQSRVKASQDREEFLFAELAAQVHDLDCKLPANFFISLLPSSC